MLHIKVTTFNGIIEQEISFRQLNELLTQLLDVKIRDFTFGKTKVNRSGIISVTTFIKGNKGFPDTFKCKGLVE